MEILADACLAFLAAVGIWTLGRMVWERLLHWDDSLCAQKEWANLVREADVWTKKERRTR
jgi:hypothetical protein